MKTKSVFIKPNQMIKNVSSLYLLQIANYILPILTIPYLTRALGLSNFGAYSIFFAVMQYAFIVVDFGFNYSATAKISTNRNNSKKIAEMFTAITSLRILLAFFASILVVISLQFFSYLDSLSLTSTLVFVIFWCVGLAIFPTWLFQGLERMLSIVVFNLVGKLASTLLIFIFVHESHDIPLIIAIYGTSSLIIGVIAFIYSIRLVGALHWPSKDRLKVELREGWPLFFTSLSSAVLTNSGTIVAGIFLPISVVGGYAAVERIIKAVNNLFQPITQAMFPRVSAVMSESFLEGMKLVLRFARPILLGVLFLSGVIIFLREQIVGGFSGKAYVDYSNALIPLGLWLIFGILNNFLGIQVLTAAGHSRRYSQVFIISGIFALAVTFLSLPLIGYLGIPVGILTGEILLSLLLLFSVKNLRREAISSLGGSV